MCQQSHIELRTTGTNHDFQSGTEGVYDNKHQGHPLDRERIHADHATNKYDTLNWHDCRNSQEKPCYSFPVVPLKCILFYCHFT